MDQNRKKKRCTAVLLAAGSGSRMQSRVAKQFMLLDGKPLIWYALHTIETSEIIDDCILVTGAEDIAYVRQEIVERYGFRKVDTITAGGAERYLSVGNALRIIDDGDMRVPNHDGYVLIHDGARPFLTEAIIRNTYEAARQFGACVAAVPSKDTVKIADENGFAAGTPERKKVWSIQTPQVFEVELIKSAYEKLYTELPQWQKKGTMVTDDASVIELFTEQKVKLVEGAYQNIKITTPEDLLIAEAFLLQKK